MWVTARSIPQRTRRGKLTCLIAPWMELAAYMRQLTCLITPWMELVTYTRKLVAESLVLGLTSSQHCNGSRSVYKPKC